MKILIDGRSLSAKQTGISIYTENLIKSYQNVYGKSNVRVIVNNLSYSTKYNTINTKLQPNNFIHFILFSILLKAQDFDLFHSPFYSSSFFKLRKKIYILTVHDLMYRIVPHFFTPNRLVNFLSVLYYDLLIKRSLKNSNWVITVSKTTQNDLLKCFGTISTVFPEGINKLPISKKSSILEKYNIQNNNFFLYVGNSRPHKNLQFLINAFLESKTERKLIICGTNQKFILDSPRILTLGYVLEEDLYQLYINSSAFVFPSLYEGFGLPVLEALDLGTKVFCSNTGALIEFSASCVSFFDPIKKDSLIKLLESVDSISFESDLIQNELKKYDWVNLMEVFQQSLTTKMIAEKW